MTTVEFPAIQALTTPEQIDAVHDRIKKMPDLVSHIISQNVLITFCDDTIASSDPEWSDQSPSLQPGLTLEESVVLRALECFDEHPLSKKVLSNLIRAFSDTTRYEPARDVIESLIEKGTINGWRVGSKSGRKGGHFLAKVEDEVDEPQSEEIKVEQAPCLKRTEEVPVVSDVDSLLDTELARDSDLLVDEPSVSHTELAESDGEESDATELGEYPVDEVISVDDITVLWDELQRGTEIPFGVDDISDEDARALWTVIKYMKEAGLGQTLEIAPASYQYLESHLPRDTFADTELETLSLMTAIDHAVIMLLDPKKFDSMHNAIYNQNSYDPRSELLIVLGRMSEMRNRASMLQPFVEDIVGLGWLPSSLHKSLESYLFESGGELLPHVEAAIALAYDAKTEREREIQRQEGIAAWGIYKEYIAPPKPEVEEAEKLEPAVFDETIYPGEEIHYARLGDLAYVHLSTFLNEFCERAAYKGWHIDRPVNTSDIPVVFGNIDLHYDLSIALQRPALKARSGAVDELSLVEVAKMVAWDEFQDYALNAKLYRNMLRMIRSTLSTRMERAEAQYKAEQLGLE